MKHLKAFLIIVFVYTGNLISAQTVTEKWPAIARFHDVISQTFHPAEQGNLVPIKTRSEEVMLKAAAILKSDIPEEYRTNSILAAAEKLQLKSKYLNKLVTSNASDEAILKSLTDLHDTFHQIVGLSAVEKK